MCTSDTTTTTPLTDTMLFPDSTRWVVEGEGHHLVQDTGDPWDSTSLDRVGGHAQQKYQIYLAHGKRIPPRGGSCGSPPENFQSLLMAGTELETSQCWQHSWLAPDWNVPNTDSNHGWHRTGQFPNADSNHGWHRTGNFPMLTAVTPVHQSMQNGQAVFSPEAWNPPAVIWRQVNTYNVFIFPP